ncbi:MAG TPA: response regulator [Gemmataceae bacterium]|jgi:DNA-binding response OmpR family regulator|nr:response regulator [Gemmataceae bacterium]
MRNSQGLRVLIVEDDPDTGASMGQLLRMIGHDVDVALDGEASLRAVQARRPDVVLLDIGLPGALNGFQVAQRLQEHSADKRPLLIAVTGYGEAADRRRAAEAGIDLYLTKPVEVDQLTDVLSKFQRVITPGEEVGTG